MGLFLLQYLYCSFIFKVKNMQGFLVLSLSLFFLSESQCKEICCEHIGCFDITRDHPLGHLPMPQCPEDIGMYFILITRDRQGHDNKITAENPPSEYDPKKLTIFLSHGWFGQSNMYWQNDLIEKLLQKYDANIIVADWKWGSFKLIYPKAAANVQTTGHFMGYLMRGLVEKTGNSYDNMWCMGFSLGGHVCGFAGMATEGKLGRVTGLDPAGTMYRNRGTDKNGINPTSAKFVDVIHTDGGGLVSYYGLLEPRGHADFYPNGGRDQPGCYFGRRKRDLTAMETEDDYPDYDAWNENQDSTSFQTTFVGCDHYRAVYYFMDTLDQDNCHIARQACTVGKNKLESCKDLDEPVQMGADADRTKHGRFRVTTLSKRSQPYCLY